MAVSDEEYLSIIKTSFDIFPELFSSDVAIGLTDRQEFIKFKPANTFNLIIKEGSKLATDPSKMANTEKCMLNMRKEIARYPKEYFGAPIVATAIPLINSETDNVVGSISFAVSMEREQSILDMSKDLNTLSMQLASSSQQLASTAQEMAASSQDISQRINNTQEQIKSMDDILNYIRSISETTNLLGLNAAIEAARAGEHGRGFSVVSGEIRKLAANSKESTLKITDSLTKIRSDINGILDFISGFAAISEEQAAQTEEMSSGSQKLNELSENLLKVADTM